MFQLLIQSTYNLFFEAASSEDIHTIDIIIRTATASIFGYFLSSNFMRPFSSEDAGTTDVLKANSIDSDASHTLTSPEESTSISNQIELPQNNHLQIILTTAIAVFCLFVLTIVRNTAVSNGALLTTSAQATISQFRDIISGCIGFLIGAPTTRNRTSNKKH